MRVNEEHIDLIESIIKELSEMNTGITGMIGVQPNPVVGSTSFSKQIKGKSKLFKRKRKKLKKKGKKLIINYQ